jgi:ATP-dependent Lon protease
MSDKQKRSYPLDGFITSNKKPRHDLLTSNESDSGGESEGSKHNEIESDKDGGEDGEDEEDDEDDEDDEDEEEEEDEDEDEDDDDEDDDEEDDYEDDELKKIQETDPELFDSLQLVKKEIERTEPSIMEILKTPLRLEDRTKLCQYYEIYKSQEPNTLEWLDARTCIINMMKDCKTGYIHHSMYTSEEHEIMKKEEEKLEGFDAQLSLKYKILSLKTSRENKAVIYRRYEELSTLNNNNDEYSKIKYWLKWATSIPHDRIKDVKVDNITSFIKEASAKLDSKLFGMQKIKEQILLFLSAKIMNPGMKKSNLALVGPPGIGKTTIAKMIAEIMEWGFEQISFGGMDKADFLKGHEYTYIGSQPGEIVKCLVRMGHKNGVIFLDELDKCAEHPDIRAALLHLIDQSQNFEFRDNFLGEVTIDLSHIWYIGSMNRPPDDSALADRWWIVNVKGYTIEEKISIISDYVLPTALENIGLKKDDIILESINTKYMLSKVEVDSEKGVRTAQKTISDIVNKIHFILTHQNEKGELPFSTTFKLNKKLVKPIILDTTLINMFIENKELNTMMNMMYV